MPTRSLSPSGGRMKKRERLEIRTSAKAREAVRKRARKFCESCGKKPGHAGFHLHHKTYERLGDERPEDLELLCIPCHSDRHPKHKGLRRMARRSQRPPSGKKKQSPKMAKGDKIRCQLCKRWIDPKGFDRHMKSVHPGEEIRTDLPTLNEVLSSAKPAEITP